MCVHVYTPEAINDFDFVCISYNMGMSALPDMYARRAEGIHIRHNTSAHVIINMLHFSHSSSLPIPSTL